MSNNLRQSLVDNFLKESKPCIESLIKYVDEFKLDNRRKVELYQMEKDGVRRVVLDGCHFFLRASAEYTNPQLTVESVQGIIAARLLEAFGNHYLEHNDTPRFDDGEIEAICQRLSRPPSGKIVPFLLNTDDVEADRYSINPLKESIVESGQSALPSAYVKTDGLKIDAEFVNKYEGALISRDEVDLIERFLEEGDSSYLDMVDYVKYQQLEALSRTLGIHLTLPLKRMPLTTLREETSHGLMHYIIEESHKDYESMEHVYDCMGRSMKKKTTLLTVPHSEKGYGSKRAAKGRVYFNNREMDRLKIVYRSTKLYPNAIDPEDTSIARAEDRFSVEAQALQDYKFNETPSSPQFILYSLGSPEDGAIWHGIGAFGATQLVKSFTTIHQASTQSLILQDLKECYELTPSIPLQFNISPDGIWCHPKHRNIDASIGSVSELKNLTKMGMKITVLNTEQYLRT